MQKSENFLENCLIAHWLTEIYFLFFTEINDTSYKGFFLVMYRYSFFLQLLNKLGVNGLFECFRSDSSDHLLKHAS